MASITLGTLRDYWKAVYDAIKAVNTARPPNAVQVGGSDGTNLVPLAVTSAGELKAQLTGSFATLRNMIGATKTSTSVASEVFAGASRLSGRRGVVIKNEHPYIRIRVDGGAVTPKTGIALEPFWVAIFELDPAVDIPIYVISESGMASYGVVEY